MQIKVPITEEFYKDDKNIIINGHELFMADVSLMCYIIEEWWVFLHIQMQMENVFHFLQVSSKKCYLKKQNKQKKTLLGTELLIGES